MVVAAEPNRCAVGVEQRRECRHRLQRKATAPRYAYNIVHTPPTEVYTVGFQADDQLADANRFTGNAVKFLSVARFQTK